MHGNIVARTVATPIEPPIPCEWPIGPSNEQMIRRIDEHPESPNEEYALAAHYLIRPLDDTLEQVLYHVSPAGKMVQPSYALDLIREGVANGAGFRLSTEAEEQACEEDGTCEKDEEVEDEPKGDEGYDDDGKYGTHNVILVRRDAIAYVFLFRTDATTQVRSYDLEPLPEVAAAAVVSFEPPESFPTPTGLANIRPEQSRPASIVTAPVAQQAAPAPAQALDAAPFGLGITYTPQDSSQPDNPAQNDPVWSDVRAGWSAASPIILSPNTPAAPSAPEAYPPEHFVLTRNASQRVIMKPATPANQNGVPSEQRPTRSPRARNLNYRVINGVRVQDTLPPLGDQAKCGRTWHVPVVVHKRACCDTSSVIPQKYQRV